MTRVRKQSTTLVEKSPETLRREKLCEELGLTDQELTQVIGSKNRAKRNRHKVRRQDQA